MGSRSTITKLECAYMAGFLDGDGSLMLQIKHRRDSKRGWRFMATICFYQDTRHETPLRWFRKKLGIGYISRRKDGMTEVRINGYAQVSGILKKFLPHLRFKKVQAKALIEACNVLSKKNVRLLTISDKRKLIKYLMTVQKQNYATQHRKGKEELYKIVGLTP